MLVRSKMDYSELDWLNKVKPHLYSVVLRYIKKTGGKDAIQKLKGVVTARAESKKRAVYLALIKELLAVKKRYTTGDPVARMILVNHGFLREAKSKDTGGKNGKSSV